MTSQQNTNIKRIAPGSRVAVIGSGISGLSAAWFLSQKYNVTLLEKSERIGGHTHTQKVNVGLKKVNVDTGFIVFNRPNYPNFSKMLGHLNVETQPTEMSFSVSMLSGGLEYAGSNLDTMFAQRSNLFSPGHWWMIREIMRFNNLAKHCLQERTVTEESLGSFLLRHRFSQRMIDYYLLPMAAAIWSCPVETMMKFPAASFLQFFENHGLLNVKNRPQWETLVGGSQNYIDAILEHAEFEVVTSVTIDSVLTNLSGLTVVTTDEMLQFDAVVFACHPDQAYSLMSEPLKQYFDGVGKFKYQTNIAYLHHDTSLMPKREKAWSSWNYLRPHLGPQKNVAVTYWMNKLQSLKTHEPVLVTLNPETPPHPDKTWNRMEYEHPVFDENAVAAQNFIRQHQGHRNIWFCGAYLGYGFHEDGLRSSVELARSWGVEIPWERYPSVGEFPMPEDKVSASADLKVS